MAIIKQLNRGIPTPIACLLQLICVLLLSNLLLWNSGRQLYAQQATTLHWDSLPDLPDTLGVAGPIVGTHRDALIVAGGANFPLPVWENEKQWHDVIHVLLEKDGKPQWRRAGSLSRPLGYAAVVSTPYGVLCMGGNDAEQTFDSVFLLAWDPDSQSLIRTDLPSLPEPSVYGSAALIGTKVYYTGGQRGAELATATSNFWVLDLDSALSGAVSHWEPLPTWPGSNRAFHLTLAQHNGYEDCLYLISGRRENLEIDGGVEFLTDVWEYAPSKQKWRARSAVPQCVMAGPGIAIGQSHLLILGGADGSRFFQADALRDHHPGFPRHAWWYHTITDTWISAGETPQNQVTTTAVNWNGKVVLPTGEIRPRVRTSKVWQIELQETQPGFGALNLSVLVIYLLAVVGVGVYFARRNRTTDDYFRGGKHIPWWAAGCSIFATMLSSLTYTGIPSKAYAQDWVYSVGNFMIPLVAIPAVFIALPFFRRLDATSAYEYLEKRFDYKLRMLGSGSFTLFHIFRMAVVMSLTGLALAVATGLTPAQSVLLMGVLSILYCSIGGIEAVIWTDTLQTIVLLGGAVLAFFLLVLGVDGGWAGFWEMAQSGDKLRMANWHWDATQSQIAFAVIVVGGLAQNVSSYTADQAVVQRYMTTETKSKAARAIWTNALLSIPATILFFGMGTALYAFYRSHPEQLDPSLTTDQVFPLFISREMPPGIAGLIVAGIFAAAQSTVSTSMNSTATTLVTDFLRPQKLCRTDRGYLRMAQGLTVLLGTLGTILALVFIDPDIRSLFDAFIKVIGMFMGVLGGLFLLGAFSRRANAAGALVGALFGAITMVLVWRYTSVNGYLYTAIGITACYLVGWWTSFLFPPPAAETVELTIYRPAANDVAKTQSAVK